MGWRADGVDFKMIGAEIKGFTAFGKVFGDILKTQSSPFHVAVRNPVCQYASFSFLQVQREGVGGEGGTFKLLLGELFVLF